MDIMTKVRVLWDKVAGITADVSAVDAKATATAATLAGILPRIPADYSTTETATGQKWIDGKEIYMITLTGTTPETSVSDEFPLSFDSIINIGGIVESTYGNKVDFNKQMVGYGNAAKNKILINAATQSNYQNTPYHITVFYTKPDPVPAQVDKGTGMITGEDPEPETKKRKTTKKGG